MVAGYAQTDISSGIDINANASERNGFDAIRRPGDFLPPSAAIAQVVA